MDISVDSFLRFAAAAPTAFHACALTENALIGAGFVRLREDRPFSVRPGGNYFLTRNQSALIAFRVPEGGLAPVRIAAAHLDSPTFKLKALAEDGSVAPYTRLNVEKYGGAILSTWLDRPLSIAGRLLVRTGSGLESRLCDMGRDAVLIPNLPIHFNRTVNDGYAFNVQKDLMPLWGGGDCAGALMKELAASVGAEASDVAGHDLFLYSRVPGSVWGAEKEFFSCGRIDDLECAYTCLAAFLNTKARDQLNVLALLDNEEVGSASRQGADSTFLSDTLFRLSEALGAAPSDARAAVAAGFMLSADNAHALHPNHPDKYDAQNRVRMNGGPVVKYAANQKYTTDGVSGALFTELCRAAGVPCQPFANRSDVVGGGTLGNIANTHVSLHTADIGLAQLAMHSSYETAGVRDIDYMVRALTAFYQAKLTIRGDGAWETEFSV